MVSILFFFVGIPPKVQTHWRDEEHHTGDTITKFRRLLCVITLFKNVSYFIIK